MGWHNGHSSAVCADLACCFCAESDGLFATVLIAVKPVKSCDRGVFLGSFIYPKKQSE